MFEGNIFYVNYINNYSLVIRIIYCIVTILYFYFDWSKVNKNKISGYSKEVITYKSV